MHVWVCMHGYEVGMCGHEVRPNKAGPLRVEETEGGEEEGAHEPRHPVDHTHEPEVVAARAPLVSTRITLNLSQGMAWHAVPGIRATAK